MKVKIILGALGLTILSILICIPLGPLVVGDPRVLSRLEVGGPIVDKALVLVGSFLTLLSILVAYSLFIQQGQYETMAAIRKWLEDEEALIENVTNPNVKLTRKISLDKIGALLEAGQITRNDIEKLSRNVAPSIHFYLIRWEVTGRSLKLVSRLLIAVLVLTFMSGLAIVAEVYYLVQGSPYWVAHLLSLFFLYVTLLLIPALVVVLFILTRGS